MPPALRERARVGLWAGSTLQSGLWGSHPCHWSAVGAGGRRASRLRPAWKPRKPARFSVQSEAAADSLLPGGEWPDPPTRRFSGDCQSPQAPDPKPLVTSLPKWALCARRPMETGFGAAGWLRRAIWCSLPCPAPQCPRLGSPGAPFSGGGCLGRVLCSGPLARALAHAGVCVCVCPCLLRSQRGEGDLSPPCRRRRGRRRLTSPPSFHRSSRACAPSSPRSSQANPHL